MIEGSFLEKSPAQHASTYHEHFDSKVRTRRLSSGLSLIHVPTLGNQSFYLGATIAAGTRLESPKHLGISHFLEHMMFRGSKRFPEYAALAEAFESFGGEWNAATSHEHTEYWYSGISYTARDVLELFADFIQNPLLRELETERAIILRELDGETNELGHSTDLAAHIASLLWPHSSLDRPILGTRQTLQAITVEDLKLYRKNFYKPSRMALCAIGGPDDLLETMAQVFAADSQGETLSPEILSFPVLAAGDKAPKGPRIKWVEHPDNEYEIKLSFLCPHEWSPEAPALHLLARILGDGFSSRLTRHLREKKGLVYDISCQAGLGFDYGTIDIDASCNIEQFDDFHTELFRLLQEFRDQGITSNELKRVQFRSLVDLELSLNHPEAIGSRLSWAQLCQVPWTLTQQVERVRRVQVEHINHLIQKIFRPENMALVALGPQQDHLEQRMEKAIKNHLSSP